MKIKIIEFDDEKPFLKKWASYFIFYWKRGNMEKNTFLFTLSLITPRITIVLLQYYV